MKILVTGGAGYIGSHTCVELLQSGHQVLVVDNLANSSLEAISRIEELAGKAVQFIQGDVRNEALLAEIFTAAVATGQPVDAVIHFAGSKAVGESVQFPLAYYDNNVSASRTLMAAMQQHGVNCLVFSSSATVYGEPDQVPVTEDFLTRPFNPYGRSKLMVEQMMGDLVVAAPAFSAVVLRYFNPVGAHPSGRIGEDPQGIPNNLMPFINQVAVGRRPFLSVFGNDYDTPDGTGVRDYIHVCDLAEGHVRALEQLATKPGLHTYNLGTGSGISVLQMVEAYRQASGQPIDYQIAPRRPGDIGCYYADASKAARELNWRASRDLTQMVTDGWNWQRQNPSGYAKN